jgi:hypothetical protein
LCFNNLRLVARNKAERFNVLIQVFKLKSSDGLRTEIMQTEALKITNQNLTWNITLFNARKVINGLHRRGLNLYR